MTVETQITMMFARGMFFSGSRHSSPVCAMISYPSNTMNVNPIDPRRDRNCAQFVSPRKNGWKWSEGNGPENAAYRAKTMKATTIPIRVVVTIVSQRPVIFVPR